jgi:hypothetical protein
MPRLDCPEVRIVYKESSFPKEYREAEVRQVMSALKRLRSIDILGLAGMGKSNVVRFVVGHPSVGEHYLGPRAHSLIIVHIDCNRLHSISEEAILGELSRQLTAAGSSAQTGAHARPAGDPIRQLRTDLTCQIKSLESGWSLAVFLDPCDRAIEHLQPRFFGFLRSLRDQRKNICYVFASRRPVGHRHEFEELLDDPCWVGPLSHQDAMGSIGRDQQRLRTTFTPAEKETLVVVTGGHPGLLKNTTELLHDGFFDPNQDIASIGTRLLQSRKVRAVCQELWDDLASREKEAIALRVSGVPAHALDGEVVRFLVQAGILKGEAQGETSLLSPLFEKFIHSLKLHPTIELIVGPLNVVQIQSWKGTQSVDLAPLPFKLLQFIAQHGPRVYSKHELSDALYHPEEWPATLDAVDQIVKRLRRELNPVLQDLTADPRYNFFVAVRGRGYKPNAAAKGGLRIQYTLRP